MTSQEQKKKNNTNSKKPNTFLFSGYFVDEKPKGKLSPIQNSLIVTKDPKEISEDDIKNGKAPYLQTDDKGGLYHFSNDIEKDFRLRQPFKSIKNPKQSKPNELTVIIPPSDLVCLSALLEKDWLQKFNKAMQKIQLSDGNEFPKTTLHKVTKSQLRKPNIDIVNYQVDKGYREWYSALKDQQEINCYILPKTRAIFFLFTMPVINEDSSEIKLIIPGKKDPEEIQILSSSKITGQNNNSALFIGVFTGTETELPKGMYTFEVSNLNTNNNFWNEKVAGNKQKKIEGTNKYSLSVYVDFAIENHAGEFSIINADPISVEESLITQHPKYYAHLTQNAMLQSIPQHSKEDKQPDKKTPRGLQAIYNQWNNTKTVAEMGMNTLGCQNKSQLMLLLSKALHDKFRSNEHKKVAETIDLFFDVTATAKAWEDFRDSHLKLYELLKGSETKNFAFAKNTIKAASRAELIQASKKGLKLHLKESYFSKDAWLKTKDFEKTFAAKLKIPEKGFSFLGKAISVADIVASGVSVANSYIDVSNASKELRFAIDDLQDLSQQYLDLVGINKKKITTVLRTEFDFDKTNIKPEFEQHLRKDILSVLNKYPHKNIILEGHTDSVGTKQYNYGLSSRRTKSIKDWLVANGIAESRISAVGHGKDKPETSNSTAQGRAKNRRVVAKIETDASYSGAPCRTGLNNLERFRGITVKKQLDEDAALLALGEKILDCALAILSVIPVTAPFALAISLAKAAIKSADDLDKLLFGGAIAAIVENHKVYGDLVLESLANQTLLHKLQYKNNKFTEEKDKEIAHFRLRAEAIAGLMRLLIRASLTKDNDETLKKRIDKYKINHYIHNFILNDDWVYPLSSKSPLGMDEFWLYAVNENNLDHDKAREGFGFDKDFFALTKIQLNRQFDKTEFQLELNKNNIKHDSSLFFHMMTRIQSDLPDHIRTDFQSKYPIHFMASKDMVEFTKQFDPTFTNLDGESYEFINIYFQKYKPKTPDEKNKWYSIAHYHVDKTSFDYSDMSLDATISISPLDKIMVVVVFKDDGKNKVDRITPVNLQLFRYDGLNAEGPKYKSLARPLCMEDFDGIDQNHLNYSLKKSFVGKYGCVIKPFFQLGSDTFYGTKPLASSTSFWWKDDAIEYYKDGCLSNMRYGFECVIGNNKKTKIDVPLASKKHWLYNHQSPSKFSSEYLVDINIDKGKDARPEEKIFLIESFLKSNSKKVERPLLFGGRISAFSWLRIGNRQFGYMPYIPPKLTNSIVSAYSGAGINLKHDGSAIEINNFDWKSPVELVFFITSTELRKKDYETINIDWRRISGHINLFEDGDTTDSDLDGPMLNLDFHYIGEYSKEKNNELFLNKTILNQDVREISEIIKNKVKNKTDFLKLINSSTGGHAGKNNYSYDYYVYAAHVKLDYTAPTGIKVESIRPFGDNKINDNGTPKDDYFEYGFKNLDTLSESDKDFKTAFRDVKITKQYHFSAPKSYNSDVPWIEEDSSGLTVGKKMSTERLKKWLENESTMVNASDIDVRKKNAGR